MDIQARERVPHEMYTRTHALSFFFSLSHTHTHTHLYTHIYTHTQPHRQGPRWRPTTAAASTSTKKLLRRCPSSSSPRSCLATTFSVPNIHIYAIYIMCAYFMRHIALYIYECINICIVLEQHSLLMPGCNVFGAIYTYMHQNMHYIYVNT